MTNLTSNEENAQIACTLALVSLRDRLAWIQALNARALREHRREDIALHLAYDPEAAADVRELVRGEQTCCAFLRFEMREEPDVVRLVIVAPEDARHAADELLGYFMPDADQVRGRAAEPANRCSCGV